MDLVAGPGGPSQGELERLAGDGVGGGGVVRVTGLWLEAQLRPEGVVLLALSPALVRLQRPVQTF